MYISTPRLQKMRKQEERGGILFPNVKAKNVRHFARYLRHSAFEIDLSEYQRNLFLLITDRKQTASTKCRCKRTIFYNKCELMK